MERLFFTLGSVFGGLAVAAGAFGAHSLAKSLTPERLAIYEKAVRYQMYHALALLALAWALSHWTKSTGLLTIAGWLFVAGLGLFSGSLYALSLSGIRWLGAITPFGGVALAIGWLCMAVAAWRV